MKKCDKIDNISKEKNKGEQSLMSNVYTYTTEIKNREDNIELMEYITEYKELFNRIQRIVFHKIKGIYVKKQGKFTLKDKEALVKYVVRTYG